MQNVACFPSTETYLLEDDLFILTVRLSDLSYNMCASLQAGPPAPPDPVLYRQMMVLPAEMTAEHQDDSAVFVR